MWHTSITQKCILPCCMLIKHSWNAQETMGAWTRPNNDWRRTSNPFTTGGSPTLCWASACPHSSEDGCPEITSARGPTRRWRHLSETFLIPLPTARASNFCCFMCCSDTQVIKTGTSNRCTPRGIAIRCNHSNRDGASYCNPVSQKSSLMSQTSNNKLA